MIHIETSYIVSLFRQNPDFAPWLLFMSYVFFFLATISMCLFQDRRSISTPKYDKPAEYYYVDCSHIFKREPAVCSAVESAVKKRTLRL